MELSYQSVQIRTNLQSGDLGTIIHLHGRQYAIEYQYGISFEAYVAKGLYEFYSNYDPSRDCVWICEQNFTIVGFLLLMHREDNAAQLRFFLLLPEFRGIGLGKKLMELYMQWLVVKGYTRAYLWTTNEQREAAALYKKFGFILSQEFNSDIFGKVVTEQRYDYFLPC